MTQTVEDIKGRLRNADEEQYDMLARMLSDDPRKGVQAALVAARRRLDAEHAESARIGRLYDFQERIAGGGVLVGLDEVGRGPLAGPLTVAGVVLPETPRIPGLNDSKQVTPVKREELSEQIRSVARAYAIVHIPPSQIDEEGMTACLRSAFSQAVARIEEALPLDVVLLDGNPLHFDSREVNVVKGDARAASIAAASIIAKVERDTLMKTYDSEYPGYGFASNKGYGSADHIQAIEARGLSPIHRASFCSNFNQTSLF